MEKTAEMVKEITVKRQMTTEVKEKLNKRIFINFLIAITLMSYMCVIDLVYMNIANHMTEILLKVFSIVNIFVTVVIFELAYRKDSGKIAICGIELLFFSVIILYMPYIYDNLNSIFCQILIFSPVFCAIYYVIKSIVIYIKTEKHYQNNLSDIKEIRKEEI